MNNRYSVKPVGHRYARKITRQDYLNAAMLSLYLSLKNSREAQVLELEALLID